MNRKHAFLLPALLCLCLCPVPARGDGLLLADGRKLSGRVVEKPDGYEVTVDGQVLSFSKDDVKQWIKSAKEVIGDADTLFEEAKKLYQEAVGTSDVKTSEARFREALPKIQKARDAYVEARDLFPEGHPELDSQLVNIMKLMRLVRGGMGSQLASGPSQAPVKTKDAPPPVRPVVRTTAPTAAPATPAPVPVSPATAPSASVTVSMGDALAILVDPVRRADGTQRLLAREIFRKTWDSKTPLADVATAGYLLLAKADEEWGLLSDVVTVRGGAAPAVYKGRLDKRSDTVSVLIQEDGREVRIRTAADGIWVAPPGAAEFKAAECKINADQPSEAFEALQSAFKGMDAAKIESLSDKEVSEGVKFLALKARELRAKGIPVEPLAIFVAGAASALVAKNEGKALPELEAAFKDLGFEKSDAGSVWGRREGLAMDDYRKWLSSGEFGMAIVQFQSDYRSVNDIGVRYALGLLYVFKALTDNRNYSRAAAYLEGASRDLSGSSKDHFLALAKSIRDQSPCYACGGTHKINCSVCKGKGRANFQCGGCGGAGKVNTLRGDAPCRVCGGKGRYSNEPCPKCKTTGKTDCKARACVREVPKPSFESFADAYKCALCQGRGSLMRHVALPCPDCTGVGIILQPKSDPAKLLK